MKKPTGQYLKEALAKKDNFGSDGPYDVLLLDYNIRHCNLRDKAETQRR